jgi:hypothetical protein
MRSRIIWTMLAFGVVLIGVGMMQFRLTALQEPGTLKTRITNLAKRLAIRRASRRGIPPRPIGTKAGLKREVHITAWIAAYVMGLTVAPKCRLGDGCTRAQQISPVNKYRATLTGTALDYQERNQIHRNASLRQS